MVEQLASESWSQLRDLWWNTLSTGINRNTFHLPLYPPSKIGLTVMVSVCLSIEVLLSSLLYRSMNASALGCCDAWPDDLLGSLAFCFLVCLCFGASFENDAE